MHLHMHEATVASRGLLLHAIYGRHAYVSRSTGQEVMKGFLWQARSPYPRTHNQCALLFLYAPWVQLPLREHVLTGL